MSCMSTTSYFSSQMLFSRENRYVRNYEGSQRRHHDDEEDGGIWFLLAWASTGARWLWYINSPGGRQASLTQFRAESDSNRLY